MFAHRSGLPRSASRAGRWPFGDDVVIVRLIALDMVQMEPLVSESQHEGFQFLARLCEEWASGTNRFSQRGEALFGLFDSGTLIGVGGINRQDDYTGRLRRFYISTWYRGRGWGRGLVDHILSHAAQYYRSVVLRITTDSGDRFYRACGFMRIRGSSDPTHRIELTEAEPDGPANGSQPFRSETNIKVIGGWLPSLTFAFAVT